MGETIRFKLGDWTVTPALNLLERNDRSAKVQPQTMEVLVYLAEHAGEVVTTNELMANVWRGRVVGESAIYERIKNLRKALGDDSHEPSFIETVPKRGYRLTARVEDLPRVIGPFRWLYTRLPGLWRRQALAICALCSAALALVYFIPSSRLLRTFDAFAGPTIAVLPFEYLSDDDAESRLGESIADEVIHALSNGSGLRVIARTSSFGFQDTSAGIPDISERLGAPVILQGSVRRENGRLRVLAQLVEGKSSVHLWSEAFERPAQDLIIVEREIALAVAQRLMGDEADISRIAASLPPVSDIAAYEYYLLGRERSRIPTGLVRDWNLADAERAVEYFRRAIALDPTLARAYTGLAVALLRGPLIGRGINNPGEIPVAVAEEALAAIDQAETLAPQLAEVRSSRAFAVRVLEQDIERSLELYREAIALDPNLVDAHFSLGLALQNEEGAAALQRAVELDPLSSTLHKWLAVRLSGLGRSEEAKLHRERFISLEPGSWEALDRRANEARMTGRPDEAVRILEPLLGDSDYRSFQPRIRARLSSFYLDLGDYRVAEEMLDSIDDTETLQFVSRNIVNAQIQAALAQDRYADVADLIHARSEANELTALYEMIIGHEAHARTLYEESGDDLSTIVSNYLGFGYYPIINSAHLRLMAGDEDAAEQMLKRASSSLEAALEDVATAGGAFYLLASINAMRGDRERALTFLERAISAGWTRHWYAIRDPNLENVWHEPRFVSMIDGLRSRMNRLRADVQTIAEERSLEVANRAVP